MGPVSKLGIMETDVHILLLSMIYSDYYYYHNKQIIITLL